ncbi:metallophosphoesterase [Pseudophaeobacter arcticus]|uniref:metallophosphoesterase n=1 Tax=Pseudophaeobacter arcticus TaxID=385492 RepID=UPI002493BAC8|nr:metallophosphoesterase [Pseudophaeobacter arcticus]
MEKIIWLSDLHYVEDGEVLGHDPRARLDAAIAYINAHHRDAAYCVLSGDLVDRGTLDDYAGLHSRLQQLDIPYLPLVGNHDDRGLLRRTLPLPDGCMETFVQYVMPTEAAVIVALDTQKTGSDAGEFCCERRSWLMQVLKNAADLQNAADLPVLLFMHHPPFDLGLPMQDQSNMEEGDAFLDVLNNSARKVSQLCIGHVHRRVCGAVQGLPFTTLGSVLYQAPPPAPAWDWDSFAPAQEDPCLGVILIDGTKVSIQNEIFCAYEVGTGAH